MQSERMFPVIVLGACLALSTSVLADVRLPAIFGDNMVLQQKTAAPIWGWAEPGEKITVQVDSSDDLPSAVAGDDGRWRLQLPTGPAGGPHTITITGHNTIKLSNVLFGEVWLCSGQSNMEWSVGPVVGPGIKNHVEEVKAADYPEIRLFTVAKTRAKTPQADCSGQWQVCTPDTVRPFSATAYFFGRQLHRELKVPVGLIESCWGGTEVELWMSEAAMRRIPELAEGIDRERDMLANYERDHAAWEKDLQAADPGWNKWNAPRLDDQDWTAQAEPGTWDKIGLADFDGVIWYRATFEAPPDWAGQAARLELGAVDDADITWVNGTQVGATTDWQAQRRYDLPAGLIQAGRNSVVIRVYDLMMQGGFTGPAAPVVRRGDATLALSGWKYKKALDKKELKPEPQKVREEHSLLYNGMIAPLVPFALRGAIWYQGESNVPRAAQYRTAFPALIGNWRSDWGQRELPFYYVQIAPFKYEKPAGLAGTLGTDRSPELREAQRLTLAVPDTGMVVTTDITDNVADIHPANKQDVGARLALWALAKTYGRKDLVCSGPLYKSMKVEGDKVRISFDYVGGGLQARGGELTDFIIAGPDRKFAPAQAKIDGDAVVVWSPDVPQPAAVRFGWSDTAIPNLFNKEGLPASPFRTDEWPGQTENTKW